MVHVCEEEISLMYIAGVVMGDIEEYRLTVMPAGKFLFRVLDCKLEAREVTDKDDPMGAKIKKPAVNFELEVQNCFALVNEKLDTAATIGSKHFHNIWITDGQKDLGRVKAMLADIGVTGVGKLTDLLAQAQGIEFVADITNTPDKNNPDTIWANLKKPMTVADFDADQAEKAA